MEKVQLNKQCVRADGELVQINTQIQCLWSQNVPKHFLCYLRPQLLQDTGRFESLSSVQSPSFLVLNPRAHPDRHRRNKRGCPYDVATEPRSC
jgi:hypothetical protein